MVVAATKQGAVGKFYLGIRDLPEQAIPNEELIAIRLSKLLEEMQIPPLTESIEINPRSMDIDRAGFTTWAQLFTPRQQLTMSTLCAAVQGVSAELKLRDYPEAHGKALLTLLGCGVSKFADFCSTLCTFNYTGGRGIRNSFPQHSIPMIWDFAETNPFNPDGASWIAVIEDNPAVIEMVQSITQAAEVARGSALSLPWPVACFDAVLTDPPYYDNVSYSNLSDFFYLWLRRTVGKMYSEHFASPSTPKKAEIIAAPYRHRGQKKAASEFYETGMRKAFAEAHRVLKPDGAMALVYAHKTTLGWSTLVDAVRFAGFVVVEAWPLDTERKGRVIAMDTAALASSIFLVARKRQGNVIGSYEDSVHPELELIVRERVDSLWDQGVSGADLVIACVGAGLRAFTRFARVEYANGEEVPAERFLTEVETVVLDTILGRLSKEAGGNGRRTSLAGVDPATRFYTLWRYTYRSADLDAGEAIVFANGTHVELDGLNGLSSGSRALVEKKKGKYRLRDFAERGEDDKLGMPKENGQPAPLIDALQRTLWLMEHRPRQLGEFLREAQLNREQMRLVAQALAGPALKGSELADVSPTGELAVLAKLTANWRSVIEDNVFSPSEQADRKRGQRSMFE
jgi:putative DNA methylase